MLRIEGKHSRAFLHTAHFTDRPSHADQLHADLWWRGVNVALDPGTYRYNAPPPWDNPLVTSRVHNTLTLDGQDQMQRAGRFLWLDWAQAEILAYEMDDHGHIFRLTVEHDGYRKLGALHQRTLTATETGWAVTDTILPYGKRDDKVHQVALTWLLPDWEWHLDKESQINLMGPKISFRLQIEDADQINLFRAGERLVGEFEAQPFWGWTSLTYGVKEPALMMMAIVTDKLPIKLQSSWWCEV
jgi:hypothetical protein